MRCQQSAKMASVQRSVLTKTDENPLSSTREEFEDESLDPRIQVELEKLNKSSEDINRLELELDEARAGFRQVLTESTQRLNALSKKLGSCIEKARCYYDARMKAKEAQIQTQNAALRFERACSQQTAAKEMVFLAEQGFFKKGQPFDPAWQEMLNHATMKVNEAEKERLESEIAHQVTTRVFNECEQHVKQLQKELKRSITKSRPYFEQKAKFNQTMEEQKRLVSSLEQAVTDSKMMYSEALRNLESISDEIHQQRKDAQTRQEMGARSSGVGAEQPHPPPLDGEPPPPGEQKAHLTVNRTNSQTQTDTDILKTDKKKDMDNNILSNTATSGTDVDPLRATEVINNVSSRRTVQQLQRACNGVSKDANGLVSNVQPVSMSHTPVDSGNKTDSYKCDSTQVERSKVDSSKVIIETAVSTQSAGANTRPLTVDTQPEASSDTKDSKVEVKELPSDKSNAETIISTAPQTLFKEPYPVTDRKVMADATETLNKPAAPEDSDTSKKHLTVEDTETEVSETVSTTDILTPGSGPSSVHTTAVTSPETEHEPEVNSESTKTNMEIMETLQKAKNFKSPFLRPNRSRDDLLEEAMSDNESIPGSMASVSVLDDDQIESLMLETGDFVTFLAKQDEQEQEKIKSMTLPAKLSYLQNYMHFKPEFAENRNGGHGDKDTMDGPGDLNDFADSTGDQVIDSKEYDACWSTEIDSEDIPNKLFPKSPTVKSKTRSTKAANSSKAVAGPSKTQRAYSFEENSEFQRVYKELAAFEHLMRNSSSDESPPPQSPPVVNVQRPSDLHMTAATADNNAVRITVTAAESPSPRGGAGPTSPDCPRDPLGVMPIKGIACVSPKLNHRSLSTERGASQAGTVSDSASEQQSGSGNNQASPTSPVEGRPSRSMTRCTSSVPSSTAQNPPSPSVSSTSTPTNDKTCSLPTHTQTPTKTQLPSASTPDDKSQSTESTPKASPSLSAARQSKDKTGSGEETSQTQPPQPSAEHVEHFV